MHALDGDAGIFQIVGMGEQFGDRPFAQFFHAEIMVAGDQYFMPMRQTAEVAVQALQFRNRRTFADIAGNDQHVAIRDVDVFDLSVKIGDADQFHASLCIGVSLIMINRHLKANYQIYQIVI